MRQRLCSHSLAHPLKSASAALGRTERRHIVTHAVTHVVTRGRYSPAEDSRSNTGVPLPPSRSPLYRGSIYPPASNEKRKLRYTSSERAAHVTRADHVTWLQELYKREGGTWRRMDMFEKNIKRNGKARLCVT